MENNYETIKERFLFIRLLSLVVVVLLVPYLLIRFVVLRDSE